MSKNPWGPTISDLHILDPQDYEVDILDIGNALAGLRRWCGRGPTTVAQHSLYLADLCETPEQMLYALLHDAPEAFLSDIPRGYVNQIAGHTRIHQNITATIYRYLKVQWPSVEDITVVHDHDDDLSLIEGESRNTTSTGSLLDGARWVEAVFTLAEEITLRDRLRRSS